MQHKRLNDRHSKHKASVHQRIMNKATLYGKQSDIKIASKLGNSCAFCKITLKKTCNEHLPKTGVTEKYLLLVEKVSHISLNG